MFSGEIWCLCCLCSFVLFWVLESENGSESKGERWLADLVFFWLRMGFRVCFMVVFVSWWWWILFHGGFMVSEIIFTDLECGGAAVLVRW
jgi:hypothetical protein